MGKPQQRKGYRVEREIVLLHQAAGIPARRVILSGAAAHLMPMEPEQGGLLADVYRGDVKVILEDRELTAEVKARKNGSGFVQIERWLSGNDLLFLKRNSKRPNDRLALLVCMPWQVYAWLAANRGRGV